MRRVAVVAWAAVLVLCGVARADGPGVGTPAVVAVGDSAISGEAGRWAGNTNGSSSRTDALGSSAYNDAGGGEAIPDTRKVSRRVLFRVTIVANAPTVAP
jgi:hypothetical protein